MADSTLNRFIASGPTADRLAFVPNPPTPASRPDHAYFWYDEDLNTLYNYDFGGATWVSVAGSGSPGGSDKQLQYNNAGTFGGFSNGTSGQILISGGSGAVPAF